MIKIQKKIRRAAKSHKCYWCQGFIEAGELYQETTVFDQGVTRRHSHLKCEELIEHFNLAEYDPHEELDDDDFMDAIQDRAAEIMSTQDIVKYVTSRQREPLVDVIHVLIKEGRL